jgi:hypothetical protein
MSSEATTWAIAQRVGDPCRKLILLGLANVASKTGEHSFPLVATLADEAECSSRTVHRHLRLLEESGLIARGDQRFVEHLRRDRRPIVWDLSMSRGDNLTCREGSRGDTEGGHGVTNHEIAPHIETMKPSRRQVDEGFLAFWALCPKKTKKRDALRCYERAVKRADRDTGQAIWNINSGMQRYAKQRANSDPRYTAHPSSWLNADRWLDEEAVDPRSDPNWFPAEI